MDKCIFVIDPQSVNSLARYDYCMLEKVLKPKIFFFGNKAYNDDEFNPNVRFFPIFTYTNYKNCFFKGLSYTLSLIVILIYAFRYRPAAFHMQWIRLWEIDWLFIRTLINIIGCKLIFTVHNILPRKCNAKIERRYSALYHRANKLIAHTETSKNAIIQKFSVSELNIIVMPHGILEMKVNPYELKVTEFNLEQKYKFGNKLIFSSLGVQSKYKGTDLLLKAWCSSPILMKDDNKILLIAGKPSDIDFPKSLPKNVIIIPRLLSNAEFKWLLRRTDVMVLPYRAIDQSGVLLSLIQYRKPYCATNVGELQLPLNHADVGWKIDKITAVSISKVLEKIVLNPDEIVKKKNNVHGWMELLEMNSWENSNRILSELYLQYI